MESRPCGAWRGQGHNLVGEEQAGCCVGSKEEAINSARCEERRGGKEDIN